MTYAVREVFESIQGEGARSGLLTAFIRFAGYNLWGGQAAKREGMGACAHWCDTDFMRDVRQLPLTALLNELRAVSECRRVVLTGGEPLLQADGDLLNALNDDGWYVAIETNGTIEPKDGVLGRADWWTMAPKLDPQGTPLPLADSLASAWSPVDEFKFVLPGHHDAALGWTEEKIALAMDRVHALRVYLQPQADARLEPLESESRTGTQMLELLRAHPHWRIGVQAHKYLALP